MNAFEEILKLSGTMDKLERDNLVKACAIERICREQIALAASPQPAEKPAVSGDYVMVPREPTEEMLIAAVKSSFPAMWPNCPTVANLKEAAGYHYVAMIEAASFAPHDAITPPPENRAALEEAKLKAIEQVMREEDEEVGGAPLSAGDIIDIAFDHCALALSAPPYKPAAPDELIREMLAALKFINSMADEEYNYQMGNVGAECALRHIIEKSSDAIAKAQAHLEKEG